MRSTYSKPSLKLTLNRHAGLTSPAYSIFACTRPFAAPFSRFSRFSRLKKHLPFAPIRAHSRFPLHAPSLHRSITPSLRLAGTPCAGALSRKLHRHSTPVNPRRPPSRLVNVSIATAYCYFPHHAAESPRLLGGTAYCHCLLPSWVLEFLIKTQSQHPHR